MTLWTADRLSRDAALQMTVESLRAHATQYDHWGMAWSGGKDSTALISVVTWLIQSGSIPRPKSLTILQADTRSGMRTDKRSNRRQHLAGRMGWHGARRGPAVRAILRGRVTANAVTCVDRG